MTSVYLALPLMLLLMVVQAAVLPYFPIWGLVPQLLFLAAVAWGLLRGIEEGALWAFWAGLFTDLFSAGPMGISSLAMMAAVIVVAAVQRRLPSSRTLLPLLLAGLATLIYQAVYLFLLTLTGYPLNLEAIALLAPMALLHAALTLPAYGLLGGLARLFWPRPVEL